MILSKTEMEKRGKKGLIAKRKVESKNMCLTLVPHLVFLKRNRFSLFRLRGKRLRVQLERWRNGTAGQIRIRYSMQGPNW